MKFLIITLVFFEITLSCYGQIDVDHQLTQIINQHLIEQNKGYNVSTSSLNYNIVNSSDFQINVNNIVKLPEAINSQTWSSKDCSPEEQSWSETFTQTAIVGSNITITQGLVSTKTLTISASFAAYGLSLGGNSTQTMQISNTLVKQFNNQTTETINKAVNTKVEPMTELFFTLSTTLSQLRIPFTVTITVNGTIHAHVAPPPIPDCSGIACYVIQQNLTKDYDLQLSDLLSEQERTFQIAGFIDNSNAEDISTEYDQKALTEPDCPIHLTTASNIDNRYSTLITKLNSTQNISKSNLTKALNDYNFSGTSAKQINFSVQHFKNKVIIKDFNNSMVIPTSGIIGNIKIQHFLYGGKPSIVTAIIDKKTKRYKAMPLSWSGWHSLPFDPKLKKISIAASNNSNYLMQSQIKYIVRK